MDRPFDLSDQDRLFKPAYLWLTAGLGDLVLPGQSVFILLQLLVADVFKEP